MVRCNLAGLLWEKRLRLAELTRRAQVDYTTGLRLYHNQSRGIQFDTLEKLCRALDCTPSDLLMLEEETA